MRIFTIISCLFMTIGLGAQVPDGSIAPDFTLTTLDGGSYNLYNELDAGRAVIMDVSATWCGPCWSYHNSGNLETVWDEHGPDGDNTMSVVMIEADDDTNEECLYGPAGCNDATAGNWVAGTPYPISNADFMNDLFNINYFPTLYLVCPDRTIVETGQAASASLIAQANACPKEEGMNNGSIRFVEAGGPSQLCEASMYSPSFRLQNYGSEAMTSATIELSYNGTVIETLNWTGSLNTYGSEMVSFTPFMIDQIGDLTATIKTVNGTTDDLTSNDSQFTSITAAPEVDNPKLVVYIETESYGADLYWECRKLDGTVIAKGGNEDIGPDGGGQFTTPPSSPTAYDNDETYQETFYVPEDGCYYLHVVSGAGNGLSGGQFKLYQNIWSPFFPATAILSSFKNTYDLGFVTSQSFVSAEEEVFSNEGVKLFPNPAQNELTVEFDLKNSSELGFQIVNTLGQVVYTESPNTTLKGYNQKQITVSDLTEGVYFLNILTEKGTVSRQFSVSK